MKPLKILFVIPDMQQGGAERVASVMLNHWAEQHHHVHLCSFSRSVSFYPLHDSIQVHLLNSDQTGAGVLNFIPNNFNRITNYIRVVKRVSPDVIISFTDNANVFTLFYNVLLRQRIIIAQRTNPLENTLIKSMKWMPGVLYRNASALVVQTKQTLEIYRKMNFKMPPIVEIIQNPLTHELWESNGGEARKNIILAVGRLNNHEKQFDRLIKIFKACRLPGWQLHIAGTGKDEQALQELIKESGLENAVMLLGEVTDMKTLYQSAKIFALTSAFEGMPNALCEAMANGCACVSYDCQTGPAELISNGEDGILVAQDDEAEFGRQLGRLMADESEISRIAGHGIEIRERLDADKIMGQWNKLIEKVIKLN